MENVKNWIVEWCDLFPDIKWNGISIKSEPKDCVNKMIKFTKDFGIYDKDTIFAATKLYLEEKEKDDYDYTKRSTYFISKKGEPSLLQSYCNKIIENNVVVDDISNNDKTNFNSDWI